ncbi:hypothetical protein BDR05DRAFT_338382 [Suillus weaverae]|nr:hypothetical protein BDR05DRAFT_338382 [Suillus weaverae]
MNTRRPWTSSMTTSDGYALIMMFGTFIAAMLLMQADHSRPLIPMLLVGPKHCMVIQNRSMTPISLDTMPVLGNYLHVIESIHTHSDLSDVAQADKSRSPSCAEESAVGGGALSILYAGSRHVTASSVEGRLDFIRCYTPGKSFQIMSNGNVQIRLVAICQRPLALTKYLIGYMKVASCPRSGLGAKSLRLFEDASLGHDV